MRRCQVPSGTGQEGWLQRVVGRSLSIVRAWQASAASDYVMGQLLLLAVGAQPCWALWVSMGFLFAQLVLALIDGAGQVTCMYPYAIIPC